MILKKPYCFIFFPISLVYGLVIMLRHFLYDMGFLRSVSFPFPIICIGNVALGGTGKSPLTEYLIRLLSKDYKVAVLSRGYKRKTQGFVLADQHTTVSDIGDEPFQYFRKFKNIIVTVGNNRVEAIKQIPKNDIVLLDDAFQHRPIKAGLNIVLTMFGELYTDDHLLPMGTLRDLKSRVKTASCIVVTKCPDDINLKTKQSIVSKIRYSSSQKVFFASIKYKKVEGYDPKILEANNPITLITGIANPKPLLLHLKEMGVRFTHFKFSDHHNFSEKDIAFLQSKNNLLTTEKDFVRLQHKLPDLSYLPIEMQIHEKEAFDNFIVGFMKKV